MVERIGRVSGGALGEEHAVQKPGQGPGFGKVLTDYLRESNEAQLKADESVTRMAAGEQVNLHEVMIHQKEAQISLQLLLQIRNKLVQAYKDIMRLPL
jgi:flagellar hook-basal body complex protein FliE